MNNQRQSSRELILCNKVTRENDTKSGSIKKGLLITYFYVAILH